MGVWVCGCVFSNFPHHAGGMVGWSMKHQGDRATRRTCVCVCVCTCVCWVGVFDAVVLYPNTESIKARARTDTHIHTESFPLSLSHTLIQSRTHTPTHAHTHTHTRTHTRAHTPSLFPRIHGNDIYYDELKTKHLACRFSHSYTHTHTQ